VIDGACAESINAIFKVERSGKDVGDDSERPKNDWEKWYEVWDVLSPDITPPVNPCESNR